MRLKFKLIFGLALAAPAYGKGGGGGSTSADNRSNSWGSFTAGIGGSGNEGMMGRIALTGHLGSHLAAEGYSFSTLNLDSTIRGTGVRGLFFLGNSFYVAAGPEKRTIYRSGDVFSATRTRDTFKDAGLAYGLGNRWQWGAFTLGCEWVGGFERKKLYSATHAVYQVNGPNSETKISEAPYTANDYFRTDTRALQLSLGVPF